MLLGGSARVGSFAVLVQATLIADADGVLVVAFGMCPYQVLVPCLVHLSVAGNVVMIACEPEAGVVVGNKVLDGVPAVAAGGAAEEDDEIDFTHDNTKNVVINNVMLDKINLSIFPIVCRLFLINLSIII